MIAGLMKVPGCEGAFRLKGPVCDPVSRVATAAKGGDLCLIRRFLNDRKQEKLWIFKD